MLTCFGLAIVAVLAGGLMMPATAEIYDTGQIGLNVYNEIDTAQLGGFSYAVWSAYDSATGARQIYTIDSVGLTTQLTNTDYDNIAPVMGTGQNLVWSGFDGSDWEVFYYNGSTTTQITDNSFDDAHTSYLYMGEVNYYPALINSSNNIIWSGWDGTDMEIYVYNATTGVTTQMTDNDYWDDFPRMNNNGIIAWRSQVGDTYYVNLYDGSSTSQIASNSSSFANLRLNNNNQLAWCTSDGTDKEIYFYSSGVTTQVTNNSYNDEWPRLSDDGRMVWHGQSGTYYEIFYYKVGDAGPTEITNPLAQDNYLPVIVGGSGIVNDRIAWYGFDGNDYEIFTYDGSNLIQQITDNSYDDKFVKVNNAGQMLWVGQDEQLVRVSENGIGQTGWNLWGASGDYSRYDFVYHYDSNTTERYSGSFYAPSGFQAFLQVGTNLYNEPSSMGGFSFNGGYYNITKITEGYDSFWDKKSFINSYFEPDYSQNLSVNSTGAATGSNIYVADRTLAHESGYALYNGQPGYFDPFSTAEVYSSTGFSRFDFYYYYYSGDYYTGYVYLPTSMGSDLLYELVYDQPAEMGGAALGGYYYFYNQTNGFGPSYNLKGYVTNYYDSVRGWLSVSPNPVYVADRLKTYEYGYVIYGSQYQYFDPYYAVNF